MSDDTGSGARVVRAGRFVIAVAFAAFPALAAAQDCRIDDPPEAPQSAGSSVQPPPPGLLKEPRLLNRTINLAIDKFGDTGRTKEGLYLELSNMITGSGWVSLGPGYRRYVLDRRAFIDGSAATSWHLYKMVQGRFEMPELADNHLSVGAQAMWQDQTQINYFGIGSDSLEDDQSQYRMKSTDVVGYATARPNTWLAVGGEFGWLRRPKILSPGGTFRPDFPETTEQFPNDPGVSLPFQPNFLHGEASLASDTRDHRGHPTSGGLYRAALTTYSDRSTGTFSFRQYEAEAAHFVPVAGPIWILALHGWVVASDVPAGHDIPFYFLPSLGGNNTVRGYSNYRFHDRNLAVVNVESRWALYRHVDGAVFFDAGNVAHRFEDLNLDKTSWGAGLRVHTERTTVARVEVAKGAEGWHFLVRTSDPLRLSRLTRRVAALPFVP
jgi:Omp85 superfamily domain